MNAHPHRPLPSTERARVPLEIRGDCFSGRALDRHVRPATTVSGQPTTRRSDLGDRLYRFRHQGERALLDGLVNRFAKAIETLFGAGTGLPDLLVAVPVSPRRPDYPRVVEFVTSLSRQTGIALAQHAVTSMEANEPEENRRTRTFAFASTVTEGAFRGKSVLVIDDLYRSGRSLHAFCRFLNDQGGATDIRILVGTIANRTRRG